MSEARWYVVHTYSGYENKVKADIEKTIENRKLQDVILEVSVPMQNVMEEKADGEEKLVQKKLFPAYVLINMIMNDETWYVVRNTRGVTGFVGPGSKPVPLTDEEMESMGLNAIVKADIDLAVGETVMVTKGVWQDTTGIITAVSEKNQTVTINIDMFGRETPVEISFTDIKKL
ncbi:MAG: transcription termination/antitermination factor NusG [Lachnospiraceae bacterium]|nr:transcription termination/antitermination factor NusG [Lachnospiraceae bacterium]